MSALPPKAHIAEGKRDICFVPKADPFVAAISAEPHREWSCYPEATPSEFLSAMEIEARAATKRNPKPSTQHRSGWGACCLTLASKLGGPHPRGIFLCNGHPPFALH